MANYPHIEEYYSELERIIAFSGVRNEESIRGAFQTCLSSYCKEHKGNFALVTELRTLTGVKPDGTVKDSNRMSRGYWEAKDLADNLDAEIRKKFNLGYPQDNILFENSRTAVLYQKGYQTMRIDMRRPGELHRLIKRFLDYELPQIKKFREAQSQFAEDLPVVLDELRSTIEDAKATNAHHRDAAADFLQMCRLTIGPDTTAEDVREMLLQHLLTKDIFLHVFGDTQFHTENNIAKHLDTLESTFFTGAVKHEAIDRLRVYYREIGRAAHDISDYAEKQQFIKAIYENFYKVYNPKAADRLGVVYTPNEVVDFMIRGTDHLLQKHFGRGLEDEKVQILDPATGTGTFITNIINYLPIDRLEYKYRYEMHANEVAILPYYIANLNIEYTYKERTGRYVEFSNLCFVDTLDNLEWTGMPVGGVERQGPLIIGGISTENRKRVENQNTKSISVIIGNPPYNANQRNENENNKNREYDEIDQRIKETYVDASTAQKTKQYDMYKRFIRWASDRLDDNGIIAFVSNSAFLDARQDDGFRKVVADEFSELYVIDLKGNARTSGERRRREGGNIFNDKIRVGVAIYFLVRRKGAEGVNVFYNAIDDYAKAPAKADYIRGRSLETFDFVNIISDEKGNWLNQSDSDFDTLIPVANRETKFAKRVLDEQAIFRLYSLGIVTARDEWVFDYSFDDLTKKVKSFVDIYQRTRTKHGGKKFDEADLGTEIKWTRDLKKQLRHNHLNGLRQETYPRLLIPSIRLEVAIFQPVIE